MEPTLEVNDGFWPCAAADARIAGSLRALAVDLRWSELIPQCVRGNADSSSTTWLGLDMHVNVYTWHNK